MTPDEPAQPPWSQPPRSQAPRSQAPDRQPRRRSLQADCSACIGLCCVGPTFAVSAEFAIDKPAGTPCPNLGADFRCGIHEGLRERGFGGCVVFDCFGAGQRLVGATFAKELAAGGPGHSWIDDRELASALFEALSIMRQLHELLWYLDEALALPVDPATQARLAEMFAEIEQLAGGTPQQLAELDVAGYRGQVGVLLGQVSRRVRPAMLRRLARERGRVERQRGRSERQRGRPGQRPDRKDRTGPRRSEDGSLGEFGGADLVGRSWRSADLRGANLRGALLLGADLRMADLSCADLLGADLRGADLRGARLTGALFVTRSQLESVRGDSETELGPGLRRPAHWSG